MAKFQCPECGGEAVVLDTYMLVQYNIEKKNGKRRLVKANSQPSGETWNLRCAGCDHKFNLSRCGNKDIDRIVRELMDSAWHEEDRS